MPRSAALLTAMMRTPQGMTGEEGRFYIFGKIGFWVGAGVHALFAVAFAANGVTFMVYYNVIVAALFALAGRYALRRGSSLWLTLGLFGVEVPLHALLGTLYTGFEPLFWVIPYCAAITPVIAYQLSWQTRALMAGGMVILGTAIGIIPFFVDPWSPLDRPWVIAMYLLNAISILGSMIFYLSVNQFLVAKAEAALAREYDRAEGLLKNILPDPIALRLKNGEHLIADDHPEVSVIFADIVNFTEASAKLRPAELVETLNLVFTEFDRLAEKHGAEKIKTIGDAYMAVVGVPTSRADHATIAVEIALDMLKTAREVSARTHFPIDLRIGVNSGPVVAGVIGQSKFAYDLWGDAVNVAARMETHGHPGAVLVTEATRAALGDRFDVAADGTREVKGKGEMPVFRITAPAAA